MLRLYNSLSRTIEEFKPLNPPRVTMYTCGPTVYDFAHIGNFRTYTMADILVRTLKYNSFDVKYVMNITDVGHLTGDNLGDADVGEDRLEKSARREGKTAWEIAEFYTDAFLQDYQKLNLTQPEVFARATEHINEQIDLIKRLEEQGYTYRISDGIYFDTSKFKDYGKLSDMDQIKEGARVEMNEEKRNPRDFALWKFSPKDTIRQMEWDSPWGKGFPGWHIECSAMSMKYLGETIDIHAGGMDLKQIHHPNEIAQSEAATHKQFVRYWFHVAFMLVQGERMSKSLGNNYKLYDLEKEGYDPMDLRYLYLQTHYRQEMNFTFGALDAARNALKRLKNIILEWDAPKIGCAEYEQKFLDALNDDLNTPEALAVVWDLVKSDYPTSAKARSLFKMDEVLGFNLKEYYEQTAKYPVEVPQEVLDLVEERARARKNKQYMRADQIRNRIRKLGFDIQDTEKGTEIRKIS
ncbi:MAG: cysteine--tRNA ligase [Patescibacteria group bacterium]|nr:MAG: cysteine--tRNA ligase [Patescibacteria group bacterium]